MNHRRRPILKTLLKLAVSVALIVLLVRGTDISGVLRHMMRVQPWSFAAAVMITLAVSLAHAARWKIVIEALGSHLEFIRALQIVLIGYFFNQVLPSSVGGDAMRVWRAYRSGLALSAAVNTVVLDRVSALAALIVITLVGLPWLNITIQNPAVFSALVVASLCGAAGLLFLMVLDRMPKAMLRWRAARGLARLSSDSRALFLHPRYAVPSIGLAIVAQLVGGGLVVFILARGIGVGVGLLDCLLLVPPVILVTMVPVSIAGWGVREGAMVVSLGFAGVSSEAAFGISLLYGIAVLLAGLPGGAVWLASGRPRGQPLPVDPAD